MGKEVQNPGKLPGKLGTPKVEAGRVLRLEWFSAMLNTERDELAENRLLNIVSRRKLFQESSFCGLFAVKL